MFQYYIFETLSISSVFFVTMTILLRNTITSHFNFKKLNKSRELYTNRTVSGISTHSTI
jgi:hypothetical protein